jgi:hypothetical protein
MDISKYNFDSSSINGYTVTYKKEVNKSLSMELDVDRDSYTLSTLTKDKRTIKRDYLFSRYLVTKQEQLDFLMCNGRSGWVFKPIQT